MRLFLFNSGIPFATTRVLQSPVWAIVQAARKGILLGYVLFKLCGTTSVVRENT